MTRDKVASAVAGLIAIVGPVKEPRRAPSDVVLERDVHVAHLAWMLGEIVPFYDAGRIEKAMRWLGYVQGACVALGMCTIDAMKDLNKPDDVALNSPLTGGSVVKASEVRVPIHILSLRWAKDSELRSKDPWHREGFAETSNGTEIHFCGAYHSDACKGECGLPRLIRRLPDGTVQAARVAMGICTAYSTDVLRGEWNGSVVEVEQEGNPMWC